VSPPLGHPVIGASQVSSCETPCLFAPPVFSCSPCTGNGVAQAQSFEGFPRFSLFFGLWLSAAVGGLFADPSIFPGLRFYRAAPVQARHGLFPRFSVLALLVPLGLALVAVACMICPFVFFLFRCILGPIRHADLFAPTPLWAFFFPLFSTLPFPRRPPTLWVLPWALSYPGNSLF